MKYLLSIPQGFHCWLKRAFSPRVEDSVRLRVLGMVSLWLAAAGLVWAGGSLWMTLGGAALGALGYGVSWQRRRHKSRVWPLLIASLIIALAFVMRSQVLEAFTGNWLPLGQFLVLVQALSSFDVRTRGGLYTALLLSGVVLFFASQQAFDGTFGVCLIGFVVLLLAFLSVSFLEDGARAAQVYWKKRQASIVLFWTGAACGVFALSGLAFWLMPRGETNLGLPQVAILPFSTNSLDSAATVPDVNLATIPVALGRGGEESALPIGPAGSPSGNDNMVGALSNRGDASGQMPGSVFLGNINKAGKDSDVVFFVRSKVASYWRGRALDIFDGRHWRASSASPDLARSRYSPQVWLNQESFGLDNRLRYTQTFFIQQDAPDAVFTGYRGVRVIAEEGSLQGPGVREGDSYQVISAHPKHSIERLRRSRAGWVGSRYLALPGGSGRLQELARRITQGADGDFAKLERIMGYLASQGKFDPHRPGDLTSSASLGEFLFEGQPGSALDTPRPRRCWPGPPGCPQGWPWATCRESATPCPALIWCGSGTPTPGPRYISKARAWVPIDSAPRPDITLLFNTDAGVGYLFQGGFGEQAFQAAKATPGKLAETIPGLMDNKALWGGGAALFYIGSLALGWRRFRGPGRRRRDGWDSGLVYSSLPGEGRRELLQLYRQMEKLLRRRGAEERMPWQTVGEYTALAASENLEAQAQLSWFADAVWYAAYNPDKLPAGLLAEGRQRLARLKALSQPPS